jgi:hypothetical protein
MPHDLESDDWGSAWEGAVRPSLNKIAGDGLSEILRWKSYRVCDGICRVPFLFIGLSGLNGGRKTMADGRLRTAFREFGPVGFLLAFLRLAGDGLS